MYEHTTSWIENCLMIATSQHAILNIQGVLLNDFAIYQPKVAYYFRHRQSLQSKSGASQFKSYLELASFTGTEQEIPRKRKLPTLSMWVLSFPTDLFPRNSIDVFAHVVSGESIDSPRPRPVFPLTSIDKVGPNHQTTQEEQCLRSQFSPKPWSSWATSTSSSSS